MALSLTELTLMRDDLIKARAKGIRTLQLNGERVEYKTDAEMVAALADLEARIQRALGASRPAMVRFGNSKGF